MLNSDYFLNNKDEFMGNSGGVEKLMNFLKNVANKNVDSNITTLGIDVGACVGNSIDMIKDICSLNTSILLFEPNPSNYNTLEELIKNNLVSNCKVFKNAVSDKIIMEKFLIILIIKIIIKLEMNMRLLKRQGIKYQILRL